MGGSHELIVQVGFNEYLFLTEKEACWTEIHAEINEETAMLD
jgi:hypothetical protein